MPKVMPLPAAAINAAVILAARRPATRSAPYSDAADAVRG